SPTRASRRVRPPTHRGRRPRYDPRWAVRIGAIGGTMADAEQDRDGDPDSVRASVVVGSYRVDVGSPAGSSIEPLPPGAAESNAAQAELSRAISRRKPPG